MNLKLASSHHRNVVLSFACLIVFAKLSGIASGKESNTIITLITFALFVWHGISIFQLGKALEKDKKTWALAGILAPVLIFIPSLLAIISANKIFKQNNWKVNFYGGATEQGAQLNLSPTGAHNDDTESKICCHCAEKIKSEAEICRYCGLDPDLETMKANGIIFDGEKYKFLDHLFSKRSDALKYAKLKAKKAQ